MIPTFALELDTREGEGRRCCDVGDMRIFELYGVNQALDRMFHHSQSGEGCSQLTGMMESRSEGSLDQCIANRNRGIHHVLICSFCELEQVRAIESYEVGIPLLVHELE